jgi:hypothetical protein
VIGPYQVQTHPVMLKATNRKPPDLGPRARIEGAHLDPPQDESGLKAIIKGAGLRDVKGFKTHGTEPAGMWLGAWTTNLSIEFDLADAVPLGAIEVWNYNAEWQTTNGIRKADIAVSADGTNWQTVMRGAEFAEAWGVPDYDDPTVLKFNGVTARKVRFENIVPWSDIGKAGLSGVVFHEAAGPGAVPVEPENGSTGAGLARPSLEWLAGQGAVEHRVYFGTTHDALALLGTTKGTTLEAPGLNPATAYFWRVDEAQPDGSIVTGRVARFETSSLVAWWKLDETTGAKAEDATGHQLAGRVQGQPHWTPGQGPAGGALEFDGSENFVDCGNWSEFNFRNEMTVAVWIKVRQFDKPRQAIVTKGDHAWRLQRSQNGGKVMFVAVGAKTTPGAGDYLFRLYSKKDLDDGQWHHVVGLYDGRRAAIYVDGELSDSTAESGQLLQNDDPVFIGGNATAYARDRLFNGWMDDVRLYGYGLSEEEVKTLYRAGVK